MHAHLKSVHTASFKCDECQYENKCMEDLKNHKDRVHIDTYSKCYKCIEKDEKNYGH